MTMFNTFQCSALTRAIRTTALIAGLSLTAAASQAVTVFDSLTGGQGSFNQSFAGTGGNPTITELGDIITLAGSARQVDSVTIRMAQVTLANPVPYDAAITFSLYSVDQGTLATTLLGSATNNVTIASTGLFNVTYSFNNVTVPDTFYYGISFTSSSPADAVGLRAALWDYWPVADLGDGPLPVGIDPGTTGLGTTNVTSIVYGRLAGSSQLVASTNNGLGVNELSLGFTPSVQISAVPEPETYALMALGLLAVGAMARRRKQTAPSAV